MSNADSIEVSRETFEDLVATVQQQGDRLEQQSDRIEELEAENTELRDQLSKVEHSAEYTHERIDDLEGEDQ